MAKGSENPYEAPAASIDARPARRDLRFKFRFLNEDGQAAGFWSKTGGLTDVGIELDGETIPYAAIPSAVARHDRLLLSIWDGTGITNVVLAIADGAKVAAEIAREVGRASSAAFALARLEALRAEGREGEYRVRTCAHCGATIDLTGVPPTPQVYCPHCDSLSSPEGQGPPSEGRLHLCDACGYYSEPKVFGSVVIVFLVAVTWFRTRKHYVCPACMRREAGWTLLKNVPTLVGVPFALVSLVRACLSGAARSGPLAGLEAANRLAQAGKLARAEDRYREMLDRAGCAAGVHYNTALARLSAGDREGCREALARVRADCANFHPADRLERTLDAPAEET